MTVPHLMNCPHSDEGWCLDCVVTLGNENWRLREALCEIANADMTTNGFQMMATEALQGGPVAFGAA